MPPVEQNKIKRAGIGLRAYDPERAWPGYTLFAPRTGKGIVHLIDMEGTVVHTWTLPYPARYGYLTERGTLFFNGQLPNLDFPGRTAQAGVALEADWDGNILFEVRNPDHNHDGIRLRNGNVMLICSAVLPSEIASRVRGGLPRTEHAWGMDGNYLQEVTVDGQVAWEWRAWEHLDPEEDSIPWPMDLRDSWALANSIAEWPNGDIMVSFRNISQLITVSRKSGKILWKMGSPPLSGQHAPVPLPNGNLLIFDNGPHRFDHRWPYSRVLEIVVATKEILWKYEENGVSNFFSPRISNAQRLPNGNTLINEGWFGRFFEVTGTGEVVWEYVNPYFKDSPQGVQNHVFRAYRYSAEEIARATTGVAR
ncbi:MAG: aryl-sulfate sulfotransferase [Candidatus Binatia bacterium]